MAAATRRRVNRRWAIVLVACLAILIASPAPAQQPHSTATTQPGSVARQATSSSPGATGREPPSPASVHDGLPTTTDGSYPDRGRLRHSPVLRNSPQSLRRLQLVGGRRERRPRLVAARDSGYPAVRAWGQHTDLHVG